MIKNKSNVISLYCIKSQGANKYAISLPRRLYKASQPVTVFKLGKMKTRVRCFPNKTLNKVGLSKNLIKKCGIVEDISLNLEITGPVLRFGPVIGIFVSKRRIRQLVKKQRPIFRDIETVKANASAKTLIYYFSIKDIRLSERKVIGTWFNPRIGKWERSNFPLMDILYDRCSRRISKKSKKHETIRKLFHQMSISSINAQHYFDKWDLHQKLSQYKVLKPHLPKTKLFNFQKLKKMLNESPVVYLKSSIGSMGSRVMQIKKREDGKYEYSYFRKILVQGLKKDFSDLCPVIKSFFGEDLLIMQHGIRLVQIGDRNVDMRATLQRNETGEVEINSIAVRLGVKGCPITSTRSGSKVLCLDDFLKKFGKHFPNNIRHKMDKFLIKVYKCIERSYGPFGEMGIDFTLDEQGQLYLIESNSKPAKDSLYKTYGQEVIHKAFLNPLNYAKFLARFR